MTKKQQSKLKGMNLKKNNNEDHNVFTNGRGDREKSTKTTKEIF
jgi:hypothetical protein